MTGRGLSLTVGTSAGAGWSRSAMAGRWPRGWAVSGARRAAWSIARDREPADRGVPGVPVPGGYGLRWPAGRGVVLGALGALAAAALVFSASQLLPPSPRRVLGSWGGVLPGRPLTRDAHVVLVGVVYLALLVLVICWTLLVVNAVRKRIAASVVWCVAAVWAAPFVAGPPLFSADIFSYVAQGVMLDRGIDPYRFGPAALGSSPLLSAITPVWRHSTSPYGPIAVGFEALVSGVGTLPAVIALRALAVLGVVVAAMAAARLAAPRPESAVVALFAANPVVLLYLVSAAHWEAVLLAVLLLGVLCWRRAHYSIALLLIISAGGIKAPVLLALPVLVIARAMAAVAGRTRVGTVGRDVLVAAVGLCVISLLLPDGLGWLPALRTPSRIATMATPAVAAADAVRATAGWFGARMAAGGLIGMSRAAFAAGGLLGGVWVLATMRRRDPLRTIGFLLLLTAVCGPVLHAWYLLWGLAALVPAAAGGAVRTRTLLLVGCGTYTFTELPSARGALPPQLMISLAVVCVVTAAAVTAGGALATWRDRPGSPTLPSSMFGAAST